MISLSLSLSLYGLYVPPLHHRLPSKVLSKRSCLEATPSSWGRKRGWGEERGSAVRWTALLPRLPGDGEGRFSLCLDSKAFSIS